MSIVPPPRRRRSTTQSICVQVDLGEFDDEALIQELEDRGILTAAAAEDLNKRASLPVNIQEIAMGDDSPMGMALYHARRGHAREAAIYLAREFRDFSILEKALS